MNIFKRKKKESYEEIINEEIKALEAYRLKIFNKSQEAMNNILKGDRSAYIMLIDYSHDMYEYTWQIELLRDILKQARA